MCERGRGLGGESQGRRRGGQMSEPAVDVELAAAPEGSAEDSPASSGKQPKAATAADVVSVELPAPAGWKKKVITQLVPLSPLLLSFLSLWKISRPPRCVTFTLCL